MTINTNLQDSRIIGLAKHPISWSAAYRIYRKKLIGLALGSALFTTACAQSLSESIRLNQIGFYPMGQKIAAVPAQATGEFFVATPDLKQQVFTGTLSAPRTSAFSDKKTRIADFSGFQKTGNFVLVVPALGHSYPFEIKTNVHAEVAKAALKSFYYQRMSTPLPEKYAGAWHRAAGHPDRQVLIHASAASKKRPTGTVIASPGGWYDAGDYNKYIVNSGITMGTLLALYEDFPDDLKKVVTNIPESGNALPDLLDEVLWNLRWMLTMQDPSDGGVYHKCTTAEFEGFVAPAAANAPRYVVQKTTAAALDFTAVMAQAARVYGRFGKELPGLADSCLKAAQHAWRWAAKNPAILYEQGKLNTQFDPDINTGAYGDKQVADELIWAAIELSVTTSKDRFLKGVDLLSTEKLTLQSWSNVRAMAYFTLLRHKDKLPPAAKRLLPDWQRAFEALASSLVEKTAQQPHLAPMENDVKNFVWGSTAVCANQGMVLLYQYRLTGDEKYLNYAVSNLDYLLGRNATGYSFVTGYGSKTPMHPHHRPSETDGVEAPVPGLLSGGPNPGQQDKCPNYPNKIPDESFVDAVCSYASNEIAINWNAPLVYLAFGIEILKNN